jgi:hypothetical protein
MKKRFLIGFGALAFIAILNLNVNIPKLNNSDFSLRDLITMNHAQGEDSQLCDFCYIGGTGCTLGLGLPGGVVYQYCPDRYF